MTHVNESDAALASAIESVFGHYKKVLPELQALKAHELLPVNLDIPSAVATVLGALPEIVDLLPHVERLPEFDLRRIRRLDEYAMALSHAHSLFLMAQRLDPSQDAASGAGAHEQFALSVETVADLRMRAFTLFCRTYEQARRAILFLRWDENDVDTIAPSLYAGHGAGKRMGEEPTPPPATLPTGAIPGGPRHQPH